MLKDIEILDEMLRDDVKIPLKERDGWREVKLSEEQGKKYFVSLTGLPCNAVVIKADAFSSPSAVFRGEKGECKRADFVIVADDVKQKVIIFVEMKAKKGSRSKIIQQLQGAYCFVTYCREIGKSFWGKENFLDGYDYRYVSITPEYNIRAQPTRYRRSDEVLHDQAGSMLKIHDNYLRFSDLI